MRICSAVGEHALRFLRGWRLGTDGVRNQGFRRFKVKPIGAPTAALKPKAKLLAHLWLWSHKSVLTLHAFKQIVAVLRQRRVWVWS